MKKHYKNYSDPDHSIFKAGKLWELGGDLRCIGAYDPVGAVKKWIGDRQTILMHDVMMILIDILMTMQYICMHENYNPHQ